MKKALLVFAVIYIAYLLVLFLFRETHLVVEILSHRINSPITGLDDILTIWSRSFNPFKGISSHITYLLSVYLIAVIAGLKIPDHSRGFSLVLVLSSVFLLVLNLPHLLGSMYYTILDIQGLRGSIIMSLWGSILPMIMAIMALYHYWICLRHYSSPKPEFESEIELEYISLLSRPFSIKVLYRMVAIGLVLTLISVFILGGIRDFVRLVSLYVIFLALAHLCLRVSVKRYHLYIFTHPIDLLAGYCGLVLVISSAFWYIKMLGVNVISGYSFQFISLSFALITLLLGLKVAASSLDEAQQTSS